MGDLDPEPFQQLFGSEPDGRESPESSGWVRLYEDLIAMMERQLEETRVFALRAPKPMGEYLGQQNISILEEEIEAFKGRLAHWSNTGNSDS